MTSREREAKLWLAIDETAYKLVDASGLSYIEAIEIVLQAMTPRAGRGA